MRKRTTRHSGSATLLAEELPPHRIQRFPWVFAHEASPPGGVTPDRLCRAPWLGEVAMPVGPEERVEVLGGHAPQATALDSSEDTPAEQP